MDFRRPQFHDLPNRKVLKAGLAAGAVLYLGSVFVTPFLVPPRPPYANWFPGTSFESIVARLAGLSLFALTAAVAISRAPSLRGYSIARAEKPSSFRTWLGGTLALGAVLVASQASALGRTSQTLLLAMYFLPVVPFCGIPRFVHLRTVISTASLSMVSLVGCGSIWLFERIRETFWGASVHDGFFLYFPMREALLSEQSLLTSMSQQGISDAIFLIAGSEAIHGSGGLNIGLLQFLSVTSVAIAALLTGAAVSPFAGTFRVVAAVAVVVAPLTVTMTTAAFPYGIMLPFAAFPVFLLSVLWQRQSWAALIALGPALALCAGQGYVASIVPPIAGGALWWVARNLPAAAGPTTIAAISAIATAIPIAQAVRLPDLLREVSGDLFAWIPLERMLHGQLDPRVAPGWHNLASSGEVSFAKTVLTGLVAPWLVDRSPLRSWGDTIFEPISAGLAASALAALLLRARRDPRSTAFLLGTFLTQLPLLLPTDYDRVSPIRAFGLVIVLSCLAAYAARQITSRFCFTRADRPLATILASVVLLSGVFVNDWVMPATTATGALTLILETHNADPSHANGKMIQLPFEELIGNEQILDYYSARVPLVSVTLRDLEDETFSFEERGDVWYWTPASESQAHLARIICERSERRVRLFEISDRAGIGRIFAAANVPEWQPQLIQSRWKERNCNEDHPLTSFGFEKGLYEPPSLNEASPPAGS